MREVDRYHDSIIRESLGNIWHKEGIEYFQKPFLFNSVPNASTFQIPITKVSFLIL